MSEELFWIAVFIVGAIVAAFRVGQEWGKCEEEIRQSKINFRGTKTMIDALEVTEAEAYECGWTVGRDGEPRECPFSERLRMAWLVGYDDGQAGKRDNTTFDAK